MPHAPYLIVHGTPNLTAATACQHVRSGPAALHSPVVPLHAVPRLPLLHQDQAGAQRLDRRLPHVLPAVAQRVPDHLRGIIGAWEHSEGAAPQHFSNQDQCTLYSCGRSFPTLYISTLHHLLLNHPHTSMKERTCTLKMAGAASASSRSSSTPARRRCSCRGAASHWMPRLTCKRGRGGAWRRCAAWVLGAAAVGCVATARAGGLLPPSDAMPGSDSMRHFLYARTTSKQRLCRTPTALLPPPPPAPHLLLHNVRHERPARLDQAAQRGSRRVHRLHLGAGLERLHEHAHQVRQARRALAKHLAEAGRQGQAAAEALTLRAMWPQRQQLSQTATCISTQVPCATCQPYTHTPQPLSAPTAPHLGLRQLINGQHARQPLMRVGAEHQALHLHTTPTKGARQEC